MHPDVFFHAAFVSFLRQGVRATAVRNAYVTISPAYIHQSDFSRYSLTTAGPPCLPGRPSMPLYTDACLELHLRLPLATNITTTTMRQNAPTSFLIERQRHDMPLTLSVSTLLAMQTTLVIQSTPMGPV